MTAKERKVLQDMYRSLELLPGEIRDDVEKYRDPAERGAVAHGADIARVRVYHWLRDEGLIPPGGR